MDVVDILMDDEQRDLDVSGVYITPPPVNMDSDSASEDEGGTIDNLTGRQLQAGAEIVLTDGQRISNEEELRAAANSMPIINKPDRFINQDQWTDDDLLIQDSLFPDPTFQEYREFTPVDFFELFVGNDVVNLLDKQSNHYALFKNYPVLKLSAEEMKCFLGILVKSGYNANPQRKLYWDQGDDMHNYKVYEAMRRDRFVRVMQSLHCADNTQLDSIDKFIKICPFLNMLKQRFLNHFKPTRNLSYDESMIKYYGKHGCKQFLRGKPIRFEYKVWSLNQANEYLVNLELYQGARANTDNEDSLNVGKAATPLIRMIQQLPPHVLNLPFQFYFDNLFTDMEFVELLKVFTAIRRNRNHSAKSNS